MDKTLVNVLTTYDSPNSLALVYPLLINRRLLEKRGIHFRFFEQISNDLYNGDAVFINSKFFRAWYAERESEFYGVLENAKKRMQKVIWFDVSDSSGTTQFNVMPFVDGYYKCQLLKDKALYCKPFYGYRIFTDYYKRIFGITDSEEMEKPHYADGRTRPIAILLKERDMPKLHVSWNSAMNKWGNHNYASGALIAKILAYLPIKTSYGTRFADPDRKRKREITARIGLEHARSTARYQRELIVEILKLKLGVETSKISRKEYLKEIRNSKIGISPFGLGEISCRDFEVIINGALLYKQDMSHLETWPPLYKKDETYVAFSWDLSDFEDKLKKLLNDEERIKRISNNAQHAYEYYLYGDGRLEFCNKVMDILKQGSNLL